MDINKQIEYWKSGAVNDIDTAELLINNKRYIKMSQKEIIKKLQQYIQGLNNKGIPIERAFLYGSYARNEATDESDIDIMLVSKLFDKNFDNIAGKIWTLSKEYHILIEPYMVGANKFQTDDYSPLLEIVRQEGIEITA